MKEVEAKRFAGPYDKIPFEDFIQSPIGLVPKSGGKTRLIFHLSFEFNSEENGKSLNACTPRDICTVKYNDLDAAVQCCLRISKEAETINKSPMIFLGKTDLTSAFRVLLLKIACFCWMVLKAENPETGKIQYFVDKCLPFGASISCALYQ